MALSFSGFLVNCARYIALAIRTVAVLRLMTRKPPVCYIHMRRQKAGQTSNCGRCVRRTSREGREPSWGQWGGVSFRQGALLLGPTRAVPPHAAKATLTRAPTPHRIQLVRERQWTEEGGHLARSVLAVPHKACLFLSLLSFPVWRVFDSPFQPKGKNTRRQRVSN